MQKQDDVPLPDADLNRLDPMDNHISFQVQKRFSGVYASRENYICHHRNSVLPPIFVCTNVYFVF